MSDDSSYFPPGRSADRPFGIGWGRAQESAFRSVTAAHRRARHAFPHKPRRGRNDLISDVVSKTERRRGATTTPELRAGAS
jgi:hypothetical protein